MAARHDELGVHWGKKAERRQWARFAKEESLLSAPVMRSFEWAEALLADTGRLTPEQVALVLERNPDTPLTRALRHYLIRLKRRDRRPGVKPKNAAAWEFILFDAKAPV